MARPRADQLLDYGEYPILYVDDEPENLRIFDLTFRREFKILMAASMPSSRARKRGRRSLPMACSILKRSCLWMNKS